MQVPAPQHGQGLAEPGDISAGGDPGGVDELRGLSLHADLRAGRGPADGLPVNVPQPRVGQVSAPDSRRDHGRQAPVQPGALAPGGRGVDRLLHVGDLDVLAGDGADDRADEPLAQPPLGVSVLGRPRPGGRVPARRQIIGDQVRAGPFQVRRIRGQPLGDPGQLGRQLLLGRRLALPPAAVLPPHRTPPVPLRPRRVHRDPALQLHHHTATTSGAWISHDDSACWQTTRRRPLGLRPLFDGVATGLRPGVTLVLLSGCEQNASFR